ncbi:hypothetical protein HNO88_002003 [Novosphingobium chloroacetimidivorans]|uniref:Cupin type-2 domain-containing protein n=1 Tax=Novosphingobium chloroacetimidivorans TaxID=1428314 RepID=A0A7W7K9F9_9SPHN|nr:cupin domain-containing protein [Novosphingobium chloroacetimidivorans]MBB4858677.1 hypothetical protein [Novosphingobium chloroacetimidivorans]
MTGSNEALADERKDIRYVRRIVTGERPDGRSYIVSDGPTLNLSIPNASGLVGHVVWATGDGAAPGDDPAPEGHEFGFHSDNGVILRIADFPPDETYDHDKLKAFLDEHDVRDTEAPRHFWFHKTPTLDYAIVLEGEIYAMMDHGETRMTAGDVLIQRATNHSWSNRSDRPCRMAFALIHGDLAKAPE